MNAEVEVEATAECGLVLQQAGQSILREVRVKNTGEETLVGMTLTVSSDIGLFRPLAMALGAVQPGETVSVPIPEGEPRLDYGFLSTLADVKEGEVRVALTDAGGKEIAFAVASQKAYTPDQTLGCGRPIYYASFVIPNCDATRRIQADVAKELETATGNSGIVGYLRGKAEVYDICKAVCGAAEKQAQGAPLKDAFVTAFERVTAPWKISLEQAKTHDDSRKVMIEESKLSAVEEIIAKIREVL